jgi:hypothetical protein
VDKGYQLLVVSEQNLHLFQGVQETYHIFRRKFAHFPAYHAHQGLQFICLLLFGVYLPQFDHLDQQVYQIFRGKFIVTHLVELVEG